MLKFPSVLFEEEPRYSAFDTARSATSTALNFDQGRLLGAHPRVIRFMKGVFESRTPLTKYRCTSDVVVLLGYLKNRSVMKICS